jgi:hypothetical protein
MVTRECTTLIPNINSGETFAYTGEGEHRNFVFSTQFCYEPTSAFKKMMKFLFKKLFLLGKIRTTFSLQLGVS